MSYSELPFGLNSSGSSSGYSSSDSYPYEKSISQPKSSLQVLRKLSAYQLVDALDEMCHRKDSFDEFRGAFEDPCFTRRILKYYPNYRTKLVKYYQWLEKNCPNFVWKLAKKIVIQGYQLPANLMISSHELNYSTNLRLGTMLMETGWYAESLLVLNVAKQHTCNLEEKYRVMRAILLAESLSSRHGQASETVRVVQGLLLYQDETVPIDLVAAVHQALSVCFFENCQFELSYYHGIIALFLLHEKKCSKTTISTYRQLAKSCTAMRRPQQASLLITQAVMLAQQCYGLRSIYYAEVLEDYAFCLLAQNENYGDVYSRAMAIYRGQYGEDFNRFDVAQGNVALGLYIQNIVFRKDIDYLMKNVIDMQDNHTTALAGSDDRLGLAAKRVRALLAADRACQEVCSPGDSDSNGLDSRLEKAFFGMENFSTCIMECLPIELVQSEFNVLNYKP